MKEIIEICGNCRNYRDLGKGIGRCLRKNIQENNFLFCKKDHTCDKFWTKKKKGKRWIKNIG